MERQKFNNDRGNFRPQWKPVKEGQELDVTIESVGEKGDGVAKVDGFIIFVPDTKKDDKVRIRITRVLKNMAFAEVIGNSASDENVDGEISDIDYTEDMPEETPEEQAEEIFDEELDEDIEDEISGIDGEEEIPEEEIPEEEIEKDFVEDFDNEGHEINKIVYD